MSNTAGILDPLTPQDCDLRDFSFMPLDVVRLRDSTLAIKATGEEFRAAVLLWCASWHQMPAGSLPDDDAELATFAGFGRVVKEFKKIKAGATRGWVKCSDGRLYHPVIAEKVIEAWNGKLRQQWRTECARIRKHNERHKATVPSPDFDEWLSHGRPCGQPLQIPCDDASMSRATDSECHTRQADVSSVKQHPMDSGQGQGQGQGQVVNPCTPTADAAPLPQPAELLPAVADATPPPKAPRAETALQVACRETWGAYCQAYAARYGAAPVRAAKQSAQVKQIVQALGAEEAPQVAAWFVDHPAQWYVTKGHDIGLLLSDLTKLRTEWATGRVVTSTAARHSDRRGAMASALQNLLAECEGGQQ